MPLPAYTIYKGTLKDAPLYKDKIKLLLIYTSRRWDIILKKVSAVDGKISATPGIILCAETTASA